MLRSWIESLLGSTWEKLGLPPVSIEVHPPERPEFGDFSTNLPLIGAKTANLPPRQLAERLVAAIPDDTFSRVEIAGPGFINLFLQPTMIHTALQEILQTKDRFGFSTIGIGKTLQVEFVSSNPTGPLTVGHGRQAVLGDVLASLYETLDYAVTREYYFNDDARRFLVRFGWDQAKFT